MSDVVIRVEGLGKRYRIGERESYVALRDVLTRAISAPARLFGPRKSVSSSNGNGDHSHIWALKDVSFDIHQGEVVGIIGRNGAGKSTLLKILARVTKPTTGHAEVRGRMGSLLEVGTGFHPELTGRENTYLNGAILGMSKKEVARKFDEIVAFAEVEKFIDTPLKHYSSGMQMRLAFAVAAHLEPEILVVDEVLAVGDFEFQKKCLGKMEEVATEGRTIIFVSHNVAAVTRLCGRCVLLEQGIVARDGGTYDVVNTYLRSGLATSASREWTSADAPGDNIVRLRAVRARPLEGQVAETFDIRQSIGIEVAFDVLEGGQVLTPNLHVFDEAGINLFISHDVDPAWRGRPRPPGRYTSTAWIPRNFLAEGTIIVGAAITTLSPQNVRVYERDAIAFLVVDSASGDSARGDYAGPLPGVVRPLLGWETSYEPEPNGGSLADETANKREPQLISGKLLNAEW